MSGEENSLGIEIISRAEAKALGLVRYFTGKLCSSGHMADRQVSNGMCVVCVARHNKSDKVKQAKRNYQTANAEKIIAYHKRYRESNKDRFKGRPARYKKDKLLRKLQSRRWYQNNKDSVKLRVKEYKIRNKHKVLAEARYRELDKAKRTPKWLTDEELWLMEEAYSLAKERERLTGIKWHVDHVIPLRGKLVSGLHVPSNLQVITAEENLRKGNFYTIG